MQCRELGEKALIGGLERAGAGGEALSRGCSTRRHFGCRRWRSSGFAELPSKLFRGDGAPVGAHAVQLLAVACTQAGHARAPRWLGPWALPGLNLGAQAKLLLFQLAAGALLQLQLATRAGAQAGLPLYPAQPRFHQLQLERVLLLLPLLRPQLLLPQLLLPQDDAWHW